MPTLKRLGLITDRPAMLMRAADGTYVEAFEWASETAARSAHDHPDIARIWDAMGQIADLTSLDSLAESHQPFSHFEPVSLGA